jgi:hypothetical protein
MKLVFGEKKTRKVQKKRQNKILLVLKPAGFLCRASIAIFFSGPYLARRVHERTANCTVAGLHIVFYVTPCAFNTSSLREMYEQCA